MKKKKIKRLFLDKEFDEIDGKPVYDPEAEFCPNFQGSVFRPKNVDDPGPIGLDGLTLRQRLFVDAYVGPAAGVVEVAAWMAGYSPKGKKCFKHGAIGRQVLQVAYVQEAIARALARRKLSEEWTKLTLFEIANSNLNNFFDLDEKTGERLKLNFHKAAALGAMRQLTTYEVKRDGSIKIGIHDVMPALTVLAKFYSIYKDGAGVESRDLPLEEDSRSRTVEPPIGTVPSNGNGRH